MQRTQIIGQFRVRIDELNNKISIRVEPINASFFVKGFVNDFTTVGAPGWFERKILKLSWADKVVKATQELIKRAERHLGQKPVTEQEQVINKVMDLLK